MSQLYCTRHQLVWKIKKFRVTWIFIVHAVHTHDDDDNDDESSSMTMIMMMIVMVMVTLI